MKRLLSGVAASALAFGALTFGACSDEPSDTERATDAVTNDLLGDPVFVDYDITPESAACAGQEVVRSLGPERVLQLGVLGTSTVDLDSLTVTEVDAIGLALETCVPEARAVVVDVIAASLEGSATAEFPISETEATCVAESITESVELAQLILLSLQPVGDQPPLTDDEAQVYGDALVGCVDVRPLVLSQVTGPGADAETIACLDAAITDDALRQSFTDVYAGGDGSAPFTDAIASCS